jgi:hypothetical protein
MEIEQLFFVIYLLSCFYFIPRLAFIKHSGLSGTEIRFLLGLKLALAIPCAFYFLRVLPYSDWASYNQEGTGEYHLLLTHPTLFFTDSGAEFDKYGLDGDFDSSNSFWGYLRFRLLYKYIAIQDLVTGGNFYLNSIVFSSIVFFGHIAFYRVYNRMFPGHKLKILVTCFLLPSVLLYTSCVHKDGIVFICTGLISFIFYSFLENKDSLRLKSLLIFMLALVTLFLFRNYVLVAMIPALFTAWLCKQLPYPKKKVIGVSYSIYALLFFLSSYIHPSLSLPGAVIKRKADFAAVGAANTNIAMNELYPTIKSFLLNLPQALNHSLFRPYLWEFSSPGIILTALELLAYEMLFIAYIFFRNRKVSVVNFYNVYGFAFFVTMMLIIGYTIPNLGAIVRYRSMVWIFILCPVICGIDWGRLAFWQAKKQEFYKDL